MGDSANTRGNNHIDFEYDSDTAINDFAGERRHIKFGPASETDGQDGTYKYNGILTCLKPDIKLYSFSILINNNNNNDIYNTYIQNFSNKIKLVDKNDINSIYNFTNNSTSLLNSVYKPNIDNYILIIGELEDGKKNLKVLKIILISNNIDSIKGDYYTDLLTAEEYLNLYYIEHFSLNIPKFISDKYNPYKIIIERKSTSLGTVETAEEGEVTEREREGLNVSSNLANGLLNKVMDEEFDKFQDVEGAVVPGTGEPPTDGKGPGEPATVVQGPDEPATVVQGPDAQSGGKKLASKVKKNKNKKNKVV